MPATAAPTHPGPDVLGRWVVVGPGAAAPDGFPDAPRVRIDDTVLAHPGPMVARLHLAWARRERLVVELAVPNEVLRESEVDDRRPWDLPRGFTFLRERLAFLVWANSYDARDGRPVWWDAELAIRGGASPSDVADVTIDGRPVWCDGGPRGPVDTLDGAGIIHRETIRGRRQDPGRFPLRVSGDAKPTDDLAPDQLAAVDHVGASARVIAPAGSGKTRVLTARLRHLLKDRGYERGLVTAVAYNTRAAGEMRERLTGLSADVRTLHSLGLWICNLEQRRDLLDERGQRAILDRLVRTAKIPNQDPFQPYLDALTECRLALRDPEAVGPEFEIDDLGDVFDRYRDELDRRNAMDFDEQIFHAIELLLTRPDIRAQAQARCTHLLVDEFQDLTPAFHLLVRLVASPALDVFGVGDDDQVIYGYAGADPGYLIDFAAEFPGAADHPLEVNYRCPPPVVAEVTTLLAHNARRVDKVIRSGHADDRPGGDDATSGTRIHAVDAGAMASRTVSIIEDVTREQGAAPADVAVLARVNATLLPVQVALNVAGIPNNAPLDSTIVGRTGIRTALAYLRLGLDPERIRREDIFDTLNRPARKVKSAVQELLRGQRFSMDQLRQVTESLSANHAVRWKDYLDDIQALSDAITDGADTARCLWIIRNRIGLGEAMDTLDAAKSRPEGSSHGDDLDALEQLAVLHDDPATFRDWLVDVLRMPGDDTGVTLSTVHRVKGMEWDHVVVFAANAGLFPHRLSEDDEEERRVFHVAVTRCRRSVAVVHDRAAASPFVADLRTPPDQPSTRATPTTASATSGAPTDDPDGIPLVIAAPGLELTAPGDVPATIVAIERLAGRPSLRVAVDGVWAPLDLDAPVLVDGLPAVLGLPRRSPTRVAAGEGAARFLAPASADDLDGPATARFEALREWRSRVAAQQGMPAYIVFNDAHLRGIARANPDSLVALARCNGVGPKKLDQYGDDILTVLADVGQ